jgi:hypothetical protein
MEGAFTPSAGVIETMRARQVRIVIGSALAVALLLALVGITVKRRMANEIRRVIVIHLDTTRVDDFSCYGGIPQTPNIDAIAAGGMRYTNSIAPLPKTSPSVASFMTGRLANRHGIYDVGGLLVDDLVTVTELLRKKGFATGGFTSNPSLDELKRGPKRSAGFDQGFDEFEGITDWPEFPPGVEQPSVPREFCKALSEAAMQFVDDHAHEKFFLWALHLDPHATYAPPEPWDSMYLDHSELLDRSVEVPKELIHPQALVSTRKYSHEYIARHMGEVSMVDHWIGKLLAKVRNLPGRTLVVITADHGESLGDADYWFGHGANIRYPCVNVPLIIACDGEVPRGTSDALVANVDIAPTILEIPDPGLSRRHLARRAECRVLSPDGLQEGRHPPLLAALRPQGRPQGVDGRRGPAPRPDASARRLREIVVRAQERRRAPPAGQPGDDRAAAFPGVSRLKGLSVVTVLGAMGKRSLPVSSSDSLPSHGQAGACPWHPDCGRRAFEPIGSQ